MTQAEQPVHSPDVTTSVNSSAHCGFSGGIRPTIFGSTGSAPVRYLAPVPEILEVELYRAWPRRRCGRPIAKVWMVDARYGRGGTTPRAAPGGAGRPHVHRGAAAREAHAARHRRRPDARRPLRHDRRPRGRRARGARPAALRPGRLRRQVGAGPRHLRRRRAAPAARPAPLRFARAGARREPARARRAHGDAAPSCAPPSRSRRRGPSGRRRSRRA